MQFQPKDEATLEKEKAEIAAKRLMKFGTICDCEVMQAEDQVSQKGNEMIYLLTRVYTPDGEEKIFDDYIVSSMEFKLRHAADTYGLLDKYESGSLLAEDFFGRSGKCKMGIQRDKEKQYPDKNVIADYVRRSPETTVSIKETVKTGTILNDEIPF